MYEPLSERELDIAERTFRAALTATLDLARAGIPPDLIERAVLGTGDLRARLRAEIEGGGMRHGVPTASEPSDPNALYFRCMFHSFFYGPFADEAALVNALRTLDRADPYWDYDSFCIHRGDPAATDWVGGLPSITQDERDRIEAARRAA